jgi:hypothetical protein
VVMPTMPAPTTAIFIDLYPDLEEIIAKTPVQ